MSKPPTLVYLAYKFSNNPTKNTEEARNMAISLMKKHHDWFVFVPHYAVDAMLDGTIKWTENMEFSKWRRTQAGMMCFAFLPKMDIIVFGCDPAYGESCGVTWENIFVKVLNQSWRKDNPIKTMSYNEAMNSE